MDSFATAIFSFGIGVLAHAAIANTTAPAATAFPSLEISAFTSTFLLLLSYMGV
jgi:hypothetical protein